MTVTTQPIIWHIPFFSPSSVLLLYSYLLSSISFPFLLCPSLTPLPHMTSYLSYWHYHQFSWTPVSLTEQTLPNIMTTWFSVSVPFLWHSYVPLFCFIIISVVHGEDPLLSSNINNSLSSLISVGFNSLSVGFCLWLPLTSNHLQPPTTLVGIQGQGHTMVKCLTLVTEAVALTTPACYIL